MKIEETIVNILFDAGKGADAPASREGICGEPFGALPKPTRAGYRFLGWEWNGKSVTAETVLNAEQDVKLTAKWEKKKEERRTVLYRQRIACVVLAAVIVVLAFSLLFVSNIVKVYTLKDTYVDENGITQTVKYSIKIDKDTGKYALYGKDGEKMPVVPDNGFNNYADGSQLVYETRSGNQYRINTATGEYKLYAVVDTDEGESLGGTRVLTRVMMFPRITMSETYSIEVTNRYGSYLIYRRNVAKDEAGTSYTTAVTVRVGEDDMMANYDPTLYASLVVSCGYSLTDRKLDRNAPDLPRKEDGSVDYAAFGLETVYTGENEIDYEKSPAVYTIRNAVFAADGSCAPGDISYTVEVGSATPSEGGYYVRLRGRDTVYVVSSTIADTVLQPVETMVTAAAVYPMTTTTYPMVERFNFGTIGNGRIMEMAIRYFQSEYPGTPTREVLDVILDSDSEILAVTPIIDFSFESLESRENTVYSSTPYVIPETSKRQLMKGYGVNNDAASTVLQNLYSMEFLACKKLHPDPTADFAAYGLDGNCHYLAFDYDPYVAKGGSGYYITNLIYISDQQYDETLGQKVYYVYSELYDMIVAVDPYYLSFLEWDDAAWYSNSVFANNIAYVSELHLTMQDKQYDFYLDNSETDQSSGVSSSNLKVYCLQYNGNTAQDAHGAKLLQYEITDTWITDAGTEKSKTYTATDNFRLLYSRLLWYTFEGDVNPDEFRKDKGMTIEEFIATDTADDKSVLRITFHVDDGKGNVRDMAIRFYEYGSGRKLLVTVEVAEPDGAGIVTYDATKAAGRFCVLATPLREAMNYADDLLNAKLIPSMT